MDNTMTNNLRELIEQRGLRLQEVAEILFPDNRYPRAALNRVLNGKTLLNSKQAIRLSAWLVYLSTISTEEHGTPSLKERHVF